MLELPNFLIFSRVTGLYSIGIPIVLGKDSCGLVSGGSWNHWISPIHGKIEKDEKYFTFYYRLKFLYQFFFSFNFFLEWSQLFRIGWFWSFQLTFIAFNGKLQIVYFQCGFFILTWLWCKTFLNIFLIKNKTKWRFRPTTKSHKIITGGTLE